MPELPEVESVRRGLARFVTGARITDCDVIDERILGTTSFREIPRGAGAVLQAEINGVRIVEVARRGKYMWLPLDEGGGRALALHLGMSGQVRILPAGSMPHRHTRAIFRLDGGGSSVVGGVSEPSGGEFEMHVIDQRIFGHVGVESLVPSRSPVDLTARLVGASAALTAPDPFEAAFDAERVAARMRMRRVAIKTALLDQRLISGIGNIYADEALHRAGVHPAADVGRLRVGRVLRTVETAREVMSEALAAGGTSFDSLYVNVNGESGYFERSLRVYGRAGKLCTACGTPIVRTVLGGRSTHLCPVCQRPQRR